MSVNFKINIRGGKLIASKKKREKKKRKGKNDVDIFQLFRPPIEISFYSPQFLDGIYGSAWVSTVVERRESDGR